METKCKYCKCLSGQIQYINNVHQGTTDKTNRGGIIRVKVNQTAKKFMEDGCW